MGHNKNIRIGQHVVYHDEQGRAHDALVTAIHGEPNYGLVMGADAPLVNVVLVSDDQARKDVYGRQIERLTSLSHASGVQGVHGMYWRHIDEEPNPGIVAVT